MPAPAVGAVGGGGGGEGGGAALMPAPPMGGASPMQLIPCICNWMRRTSSQMRSTLHPLRVSWAPSSNRTDPRFGARSSNSTKAALHTWALASDLLQVRSSV